MWSIKSSFHTLMRFRVDAQKKVKKLEKESKKDKHDDDEEDEEDD